MLEIFLVYMYLTKNPENLMEFFNLTVPLHAKQLSILKLNEVKCATSE